MSLPARRAVVLQHAAFEGPARIAALLAERGYAIEVCALYRGAAIPALDQEDLLIVMGGPMGVGDITSDEYPFLRAEAELLAERVEQGAPVLGVCLGAQLLAHAAGARVYPMGDTLNAPQRYEVGWSEITFARDVPLLAALPERAQVLHWHGDTFDLPREAVLLASSAVCKNQAFSLGKCAFGLQFHCEVEREHVATFLREDEAFVVRANGPDGVALVRAQTERYIDEARRVGDLLLNSILDALSAR